MKIKILSGTFEKGGGVIVYHGQSDNFYHLIVLEDKETGKPFVEIKNKQYFEEDIEKRSRNESNKDI